MKWDRPFDDLIGILQAFQGDALDPIIACAKEQRTAGKMFFIGNGGSAAIAAHMAADWQKAARIPSMCLSDPPSLTALSNDLGYPSVYTEQLRMHSSRGDMLFAISSSGKSENIVNATDFANHRGLTTVTLTGFDENNPLSTMGVHNIHVPVHKYGLVEVAHHAILHHILDRVLDA